MPTKLQYIISAQLAGGPQLAETKTLIVEAYDMTNVTIPDGSSDLEVNIQPNGAGLTQFLAIRASAYDANLSYKVNDSGATPVVLDGPHIFIGTGAVALMDPSPTRLLFSNSTGADVTVDVLVGRDATP